MAIDKLEYQNIEIDIPKKYCFLYIYEVSNRKRITSYVGITKNPFKRLKEHAYNVKSNWKKKYFKDSLISLIYLEYIPTGVDWGKREKQVKGYSRRKKYNTFPK